MHLFGGCTGPGAAYTDPRFCPSKGSFFASVPVLLRRKWAMERVSSSWMIHRCVYTPAPAKYRYSRVVIPCYTIPSWYSVFITIFPLGILSLLSFSLLVFCLYYHFPSWYSVFITIFPLGIPSLLQFFLLVFRLYYHFPLGIPTH